MLSYIYRDYKLNYNPTNKIPILKPLVTGLLIVVCFNVILFFYVAFLDVGSVDDDKKSESNHEYHIIGKTVKFSDDDFETGLPCYVAATRNLDEDGKLWVVNYVLLPIDEVGVKSVGDVVKLGYTTNRLDKFYFKSIKESILCALIILFFLCIILFVVIC